MLRFPYSSLTSSLNQQTLNQQIQTLMETPKGRVKLSASIKHPLLVGFLATPFGRIWGSSNLQVPCAFVVSEGQLTSVDLATFRGEVLEGEVALTPRPYTQEGFFQTKMNIVQGVTHEIRSRFVQLLREVPGCSDPLIASRLDLALDQLYREKHFSVITGYEGASALARANALRAQEPLKCVEKPCGCHSHSLPESYPLGRHVGHLPSVFVFSEVDGKFLVVTEDAGFFAVDIDVDFQPDCLLWRANLKLGISDPKGVIPVETLPGPRPRGSS